MTEDSGDRIVIGTGIDLDKRELYEVTKSMTLDRDIRKLSLLGPVLWNLFVLGLTLGTVVMFVSSLSTLSSLAQGTFEYVATLRIGQIYDLGGAVLRNGFAVAFGLYFTSIVWRNLYTRLRESFVDDILKSVRAFPSELAKSLVVLKPDTWQNQNYWHPFTSGQSDRDPLVVLSNTDVGEVSGVYSDIPYYRNVFVDSIYVTFDGLDRRQSFESWWFRNSVKQLRLTVLTLLALPSLLYLVHRWLVPVSLPYVGTRWVALGVVSNAVFLIAILITVLTRYFRFHSEFYGNSAGAEEYDRLLNKDPQKALVEDQKRYEDTTLLGNSLSGYGVFYLSEFLRNVISRDADYKVEIDCQTESVDKEVLRAGEYVLRSSIPRPAKKTDHMGENQDMISISVNGIRYFTVDEDWESGYLNKTQQFLTGEDRSNKKKGYKSIEGEKKGLRLPVKKYVSVPTGIYNEDDISHRDSDSEFPFFFHREWEDDTVHYLLLGGAEHQQALVKFIRYMKKEGYENIDIVENTFADEESLKFVSEYFVSSVLGDEDKDVFRGEDSFVLLHHEFEDDKNIHVLVGHSAVGTKVGFLYWMEELYPEFERLSQEEGLEKDVLYNFKYDTEEDFEVGDYYVDCSWINDEGVPGVEFEWFGQTEDLDTSQDVEKGDDKVGLRTIKIGVSQEGGEEGNNE